jgi:hypothetical protein
MDSHDDKVPPSEQRGGTTPDPDEAHEKGGWVENSLDGAVPAELGGSDAPYDDTEPMLGRTVGGDEPATDEGIDRAAGDNADATRDGGQNRPPGAEPDLRDAAAGPRQVDRDSAG